MPSSTSEPAVSASAANSARLASASAALPSVHTPTSTTRSRRSCRYSTSEMSASSVDSPATRRSAARSSSASSPVLGVSWSGQAELGESGYVIGNYTWCTPKRRHAPELTRRISPPFLADFASGHQHRRPTQVTGGLGDGDDDIAARHPHGERAAGRAGVRQRGDGGGDGSGTAGTGFAHSPLVHPHADRAVGRGGEDFDVDAVRELRVVEV